MPFAEAVVLHPRPAAQGYLCNLIATVVEELVVHVAPFWSGRRCVDRLRMTPRFRPSRRRPPSDLLELRVTVDEALRARLGRHGARRRVLEGVAR